MLGKLLNINPEASCTRTRIEYGCLDGAVVFCKSDPSAVRDGIRYFIDIPTGKLCKADNRYCCLF